MRPGKCLALLLVFSFTLWGGVANGQSVSDSDFLFFQPMTMNVSNNVDTSWSWAIMVDNATVINAITIPLAFGGLAELEVDTSVSTGGNLGISYGPAGNDVAWTIKTSLVDDTAKTMLVGFISFAQFGQMTDTLCYIWFHLAPSGQNMSVDVDTTVLPPSNHLTITDTQAQDQIPTWTKGTLNVGTGSAVADDGVTPLAFDLDQNAPNPFNAQTIIRFAMPRAEHVRLVVFNVLGQHVKTLLDTKLQAERHEVIWDGTNDQGTPVASGTYFYRLKIGDLFDETRQMTLLK